MLPLLESADLDSALALRVGNYYGEILNFVSEDYYESKSFWNILTPWTVLRSKNFLGLHKFEQIMESLESFLKI